MGYFIWFHLFRARRYSNEYPLCTFSSNFSAESHILDHFWHKWPNFVIFPRSECSFHGSQNDWHDLAFSTQKLVWKTMQPDPKYIQNWFLTLWAEPNRPPITVFNQYLGQYWVLLQTDFWNHVGRFDYHERYILNGEKMTKFGYFCQKCRKGGIMQALYATPAWACCFYVFTFLHYFFEGGCWFFSCTMHESWCTMHNTWWMHSRLCLKMLSFLHTWACVMPRTFLPSRPIRFLL